MALKNLLQKTVYILLYCLFTTALFAQTTPPPKQWDKRFGGSSPDVLNSLQQTIDGGYIFGGGSYSRIGGDITEGRRGSEDYWIVKTDANGIKQWDKRFGGSEEEGITGVKETTDGGYILGGYSVSGIGGDKTEDTRGSTDYWIVKIDANGIKEWDKRFGGSSGDVLRSLQQTSDGGYILGGSSYSAIGGDKTEASRGGADYWVVKIDANGIKQWDKRFGGSGEDNLYSLQQTTDGGYILGGTSDSGMGGDKTEASRGGTDYWVVKIDANGIKQWDKRFGGNEEEQLFSLQQTTDGGYILGGYSYSGLNGDKSENSRGDLDYWIVKIDANGGKQWDKRFGGSSAESANCLQQTTDGGYIVGGNSYSGADGDKTEESRGGADYWMVKTDANGIKQWDRRFGGVGEEDPFALQQTGDGGYILGGSTNSGIDGDKTENTRGNYDFWIIKLGCPPSAKVIAPGGVDICTTGSVQLIADKSSDVKFQWFKDGNKITGATNRAYTVTAPGTYKVVVYTTIACSQLSKDIAIINSCGKRANSLLALPNPSQGIITVTYNSNTATNIQLNVLDKTGKLLFTETEQAIKGNNTYRLNLSNLINGIYNLQLSNDREQSLVKIIIEK